jgi:deazaflavin-dependent oxidoreductase (nitroreductase family)
VEKLIKQLSDFKQLPKPILKVIHFPPQFAYAIGLGPLLGKFVLLLTTVGRSSGKKRVTPLQYEEINGRMYLGSAIGRKADWVKNILANPAVNVQIKSRKFAGNAIVIDDTAQIVDFLLIRYRRHPKMIGRILKSEGISIPPTSKDLNEYSKGKAMVVIDPIL